jgi:NAD/FAD-utilizing enzyme apparently involved in cell division
MTVMQNSITKRDAIKEELQRLSRKMITPKQAEPFLSEHGLKSLKDGILADHFLRRPEVHYSDIVKMIGEPEVKVDRRVAEQVEIATKYAGYIKKEQLQVERLKKMESKKIPARLDYTKVDSLATEAVQKLSKINPETIAQASRISGVNPADIGILSVYIEQGRIAKLPE